jgi:ketosteroid isomerase-like protein
MPVAQSPDSDAPQPAPATDTGPAAGQDRQGLTRRDFLTTTGVGAVVVGLGAAVAITHPGRGAAAATCTDLGARPSAGAAPMLGSSGTAAAGTQGLPGIATLAGPALKRLTALPSPPLYWQVEQFPTLEAARAREGPTGVVVEAEAKGWLFTVARQGERPGGGTHLAEIGPLPVPEAPSYLLQISYQSRAAGVNGTIHSHPGVECWYMVQGEQMLLLPSEGRELRARAGEGLVGPPGGVPLQIFNTGGGERRAFNLFVLDATQPASNEGTDIATVDAEFKRAFLARDLDATMALFADETVEISPFGVFPGREAIRRSVDTFIRANPGLDVTFSESDVIGNTAVHRAFVASDPIRAAGVSRFVLIHTMVVTRGKIVSLAQQLDFADVETAQYALGLAPEGR